MAEPVTSLHLVCPRCAAINRVPAARLGESPTCGRCRGALLDGVPMALSAENFDRYIGRSDLPIVVDFWAPWCGPCRAMTSVFAQAAEKMAACIRFAKVDTDAEPVLARRFSIRSIPTLAVFAGGQEIARQSGAMDAQPLLRWVAQFARRGD